MEMFGTGTYKGRNANLVAKPSTDSFLKVGVDNNKYGQSIELHVLSDLDINASFSKDTRDDDSDGLTNTTS